LEAPPMVVFGIQGYVNTSEGLKLKTTLISSHVNQSVIRRFLKNFYTSSRKDMGSITKAITKEETDEKIAILKEC
ncbi:hypothetical protein H311_05316, partial [Anncaliia algerae PRA109]